VVEGVPQQGARYLHALSRLGPATEVTGSTTTRTGRLDCTSDRRVPRNRAWVANDLLTVKPGHHSDRRRRHQGSLADAVVIVVSNPLSSLVLAMEAALPASEAARVRTGGPWLDSSRFRFFVAEGSASLFATYTRWCWAVTATRMVPLPRYCSVGRVPLRNLMDDATIAKIAKRHADAGGRSWRC